MEYPKIKKVLPLSNFQLKVTFANDVTKIYDCNRFIDSNNFTMLRNISFFNSVAVDAGGYGIIWNDDIDLSESELWIHGYESKRTLATNA